MVATMVISLLVSGGGAVQMASQWLPGVAGDVQLGGYPSACTRAAVTTGPGWTARSRSRPTLGCTARSGNPGEVMFAAFYAGAAGVEVVSGGVEVPHERLRCMQLRRRFGSGEWWLSRSRW